MRTDARKPANSRPLGARLREAFDLRDSAERTMALKERIYASFTGLAIVAALALNDHHGSIVDAVLGLAAGIVGITAAGFMAEVIAHQVAEGHFPAPLALLRMGRIALGAIASASLPFVLLAAAALDLLPYDTSLHLAIASYFASLILVVILAARRTGLSWTKQLLSALTLVIGGVVVVIVLVIAH
jgi:hypothetical protein